MQDGYEFRVFLETGQLPGERLLEVVNRTLFVELTALRTGGAASKNWMKKVTFGDIERARQPAKMNIKTQQNMRYYRCFSVQEPA